MKRLVLAALLLGAAPVLASPSGGLFAGPTRSNAASIFWNPAAVVAEDPGVFTHFELTEVAFGAQYQRIADAPDTQQSHEPVAFWGLSPPSPSFVIGTSNTPWTGLTLLLGGTTRTASGTEWPEDGAQRYYATSSLLLVYTVAAGAAFTTDGTWGVAALAGPTYTRLRLRNAVDFGNTANGSLPPGGELFEREDPTLQGFTDLAADGFAVTGILGAWIQLWSRLTLGASFVMTSTPILHGTVDVTAPEAFASAFPGYDLSPSGTLDLRYPHPWVLSLEAELATELLTAAVMFQYIDRSAQTVLLGTVTEADSELIAGDQLSIRQTHDDWMVGVRLSRAISRELEVGVRADWDPRHIPTEAVTPINLDFTSIELGAGARWTLTEGVALTLTYYYVHVVPIEVGDSIFNPRAPPESGLNAPSPRGTYEGWAHKLVLSFEGLWAAGP